MQQALNKRPRTCLKACRNRLGRRTRGHGCGAVSAHHPCPRAAAPLRSAGDPRYLLGRAYGKPQSGHESLWPREVRASTSPHTHKEAHTTLKTSQA